MKILFATSEAVPFIKSGGLADVAGSLSKALRGRRQACRVVMPLYEDIDTDLKADFKFISSFNVQLGWRSQYCGVFEGTHAGVKYYFIDNEFYFKRRGIYGYFDEAERFAFFSKAVLEMLQHIDFAPDIIHCHDWHTALVPIYLNSFYRDISIYQNIKTVFTIHNIQYQGMFSENVGRDVAGLPESAMSSVKWADGVNLMKGALLESDALTTVSPTYAVELQDQWYAHGLASVLAENRHKLTGILNGIDYDVYNPAEDGKIFETFTASNLAGKSANKKELQTILGLDQNEDAMLVGMVTRLVGHKGMDMIQWAFGWMMDKPVQFVLLGAGDWVYESFFRDMADGFPGKVSINLGFDDVLARRIYAGCDALLMPSKAEPCGLSQMIAMRYGTIPIVRNTGGLKDSVNDLWGDGGNGYTFETFNVEDMKSAITRAISDFSDSEKWQSHIKKAMKSDFSWGVSAHSYIELYKKLIEA